MKKGSIFKKKYEVIGSLGRGGMGNVYLVRDTVLGSLWALKEVNRKRRVNETKQQQIERINDVIYEARLLSKINHNSIPRVTEISEYGDYIYILQDYVEGITLKEQLDTQEEKLLEQDNKNLPDDKKRKHNYYYRQLEISKVLVIARYVAKIFVYLHGLNPPIIYRDLKPENLMIDRYNNIKLIDFGIAYELTPELNKAGAKKPMGTWGYAAPEQIGHNSSPSIQTDIYNYGRLLYELVTGICPATRKNKKLIDLPPIEQVRGDIDEGLVAIINKCNEKEPFQRYSDFTEVLYALEHYKEMGHTYREKLRGRLQKVALMGGLSVVFLIGSGASAVHDQLTAHRQYENMISQADMYNKVSDLIPVIQHNKGEIKPLERLIELYEQDDKFTLEEEQQFISLISDSMATAKEKKGYGDLAYDIGILYAYYYQASSDSELNYQIRMSQASQWFADAVKYDSKYKSTAKIYEQIGEFNRDITLAQKQYNDKGMYKSYFNNLVGLKAEFSDKKVSNYAKYQLASVIGSTINKYHEKLVSDGVTNQDMRSLLNYTKTKVNKIDLGSDQRANNIKNDTNRELDNALGRV